MATITSDTPPPQVFWPIVDLICVDCYQKIQVLRTTVIAESKDRSS